MIVEENELMRSELARIEAIKEALQLREIVIELLKPKEDLEALSDKY